MSSSLFFFFFLLCGSFPSSYYCNSTAANASVFPSLAEEDPLVDVLFEHAGYYDIPNAPGARMFYNFFKKSNYDNIVVSDPQESPVILWLNGMPGISSNIALFHENGPLYISDDHLRLKWREYGWNKLANIIYVDDPIGTGLSHKGSDLNLRSNEIDVINDLYNFLQKFFTKIHPEFNESTFFIVGESFAGKYGPSLAARIIKENNELHGSNYRRINLMGVAIGNGFTDPKIQFGSLLSSAVKMKVIQEIDKSNLANDQSLCLDFASKCGRDGGQRCLDAHHHCFTLLKSIEDLAQGKSLYDITKLKSTFDFSNVERFFARDYTIKVLRSKNIDKKYSKRQNAVYDAMKEDYMQSRTKEVAEILENNAHVLIYVGKNDFTCNYIGNLEWLHGLEWDGQNEFLENPANDFNLYGTKYGTRIMARKLTFIEIQDAGHMVPRDQSKVAFYMIKQWMAGYAS